MRGLGCVDADHLPHRSRVHLSQHPPEHRRALRRELRPWASPTAYEEAMSRPQIQQHLGDIAALAERFDPTLFCVMSTHSAP